MLAAETQLAQTERARLTDMVGLYKSLGGGSSLPQKATHLAEVSGAISAGRRSFYPQLCVNCGTIGLLAGLAAAATGLEFFFG